MSAAACGAVDSLWNCNTLWLVARPWSDECSCNAENTGVRGLIVTGLWEQRHRSHRVTNGGHTKRRLACQGPHTHATAASMGLIAKSDKTPARGAVLDAILLAGMQSCGGRRCRRPALCWRCAGGWRGRAGAEPGTKARREGRFLPCHPPMALHSLCLSPFHVRCRAPACLAGLVSAARPMI